MGYCWTANMIGRQVSHFYIIRALGSGGMGVVYEAQDTHLPRSVAIKLLKPSNAKDGDAIKRFKREARLAASLNHPNICTILDIDDLSDDERPRQASRFRAYRAPFYLGLLGLCYGECGMREQALALVAELDRKTPQT